MHLYIANATHQIQDFHYRVPEVKQVRQQKIPIGGQIKISGDLSSAEVDAIIKQHEKYGLIAADDIATSKAFAPLCYQIDKPISPIRIEMLANRNTGVLMDRGREQRKNAAVVMTANLGNTLKEQGSDSDLNSVTVETSEDDDALSRSRRAATGEERLQETTIVTKEGQNPQAGRLSLKGRGGKR